MNTVEAMTPYPQTVRPEMFLADAAAIMHEHHVRHLPVVDQTSTVIGMLSDRDVRSGAPWIMVEDVMSMPALVVPFDTPLVDVARRFAMLRIGALPVTDKFGALIGIVSYVDALRELSRE
jgi:CBS domain-containing protein